jgi:hypothetical protein
MFSKSYFDKCFLLILTCKNWLFFNYKLNVVKLNHSPGSMFDKCYVRQLSFFIDNCNFYCSKLTRVENNHVPGLFSTVVMFNLSRLGYARLGWVGLGWVGLG